MSEEKATDSTTFIRVVKNTNFSVINNEFLRRNDLSWKAKGILAYILTLPDNWIIRLNEVMRHATEGEKAFRSGWKELTELGYVERKPIRSGNRISSWETIIREKPDISTNPELSCFVHVDDVHVQNGKLLNTNNTKYLNKQSTNIYSSSDDERQPLSLVDDVQHRSDKAKEDTSKKEKAKQLDSDFEALWKLYPNKKGKAKAKKAYIKAIKDGVTNKEIQDGIVAYTKEIKAKNTNKEYIKHGSTWFNNRAWEDEYDTTPTQPKRYGQSSYQEPVPEHMQAKAIEENDIDLERDIELEERIKALTDKNNKNNDSP